MIEKYDINENDVTDMPYLQFISKYGIMLGCKRKDRDILKLKLNKYESEKYFEIYDKLFEDDSNLKYTIEAEENIIRLIDSDEIFISMRKEMIDLEFDIYEIENMIERRDMIEKICGDKNDRKI